MDNKYYNIYISYTPPYLNGQKEVTITIDSKNKQSISIPTYSGEYWVASIPELKLSATASSPNDALDKVLKLNTSNTGDTPLSFTRTW